MFACAQRSRPTSSTPRSSRRIFRGCAERHASGFAGMLWSKQFYHYVSEMAARRSRQSAAARRALARPQPRVDSPVQRRRDLHARQVGVPVVCGLGPGISLRAAGAGRSATSPRSSSCCCCASGTCTPTGRLPAYEWAFGDVNPPVHAWAAWRVYKIDKKRRGQRRSRVPGARLPQAAAQLHLVGEPQGCRGHEYLPGRLSGAGQYRRVRPQRSHCPPAAISSSPTAPVGWRCTR